MQIIKNVLSNSVLHECKLERENLSKEKVWGPSDLFWNDDIRVGVTGSCSITLVSEALCKKIIESIQYVVPACDAIHLQHYIWHKYSSISKHCDGIYKWGATIYLNENWDMNHGGIFIWKDCNKELHALCPEYNTMVLNTEAEDHLVTMITPTAPENRVTIQIWGQ